MGRQPTLSFSLNGEAKMAEMHFQIKVDFKLVFFDLLFLDKTATDNIYRIDRGKYGYTVSCIFFRAITLFIFIFALT